VQELEEKIRNLLLKEEILLHSLKYFKRDGQYILEVLIEREDFSMDLDTLSEVSHKISDLLDENDEFKEPYYLEVSSTGAERELVTLNDYQKVIGKYIHLEFKEKVNNLEAINGELIKIENEVFEITFRNKTRKEKLVIDYKNIKKGNLAIKF
jgi:ribosome maturation factor RimP